jgi:hypothetical protein
MKKHQYGKRMYTNYHNLKVLPNKFERKILSKLLKLLEITYSHHAPYLDSHNKLPSIVF